MNTMKGYFRQFMEPDGAGGGGAPPSPPPAPDNSGIPPGATLDDVLTGRVQPAKPNLPEPEHGDEGGKKPAGEAKPGSGAKADDKQAASEPKPEDVKNALEAGLFGTSNPEDQAKALERKYEASSKEAVRLNKVIDKVQAMLKKQNLDLAFEDGVPVAFVRKRGSKSEEPTVPEYEKLPSEIQDAFNVDPQVVIKHLWAEAQKAFAAVKDDENYTPPISDERKKSALEAVREEKTLDGELRYPDLDKYADMAEGFLSGPKAPPELKALRTAHPELALKLAIAAVKQEWGVISAMHQREQKKKTSTNQPPLGPSSQGMAIEAAQDYQNRMGDAIANATI